MRWFSLSFGKLFKSINLIRKASQLKRGAVSPQKREMMRNIRTHIILCLTLGIVFLVALIVSFDPIFSLLTSQSDTSLPESVVLLFYINIGSYFAYVLFVLFRVIKYIPQKQ
jgi:hypothetical protein